MQHTDDIADTVVAILQTIAPEVETDELDPSAPVRDQVDLDSMDWLNFLIKVSKTFELDIPESEYPHLRTLDDVVQHLRLQSA